MIRRDDKGDWLLISQVEHARIAAELAAVWGNDNVPALPVAEWLVPAIHHHDDGWNVWEQSPTVDPATSKPRDFTEMPMSVATSIWSASIEACANTGTLGGVWVSKHFCWLAERAQESRKDEPAELTPIQEFLQTQADDQARWKQLAAVSFEQHELDALIEAGFRYVQFFDRISLWLCCAQRSEPFEIDNPGGGKISLTPLDSNRFTIDPWPLSVDVMSLAVDARRIPARDYASDAELHGAISAASPEFLTWELSAAA